MPAELEWSDGRAASVACGAAIANAGGAAGAGAQLVPGDLASEHEERAEVLQLLLAGGHVLDLEDREDESGHVGL